MDNARSQHTLRMKMADVCWAHYLSLQTAHLMIIMLLMMFGELYFFLLSLLNVYFFKLSLLSLVEPCRNRDCKIISIYKTNYQKTNVTKQNKELPSIPLCTYYDLSYPVTQRQACILSLQLDLYSLSVFLFIMCAHKSNHKKKCLIHHPEQHG